MRAFEVGCYGNPVIRTPNIDRLAAEGVRFETAVTNFPVCMAARSVMLSGQYNRTCTGGVGNVATGQGEGRIYFPQYPFAGRPHLPEATLPEILHGSATTRPPSASGTSTPGRTTSASTTTSSRA